VVPIGVFGVAIDAIGSGGAAGSSSGAGQGGQGLADEVTRALAVTHGEALDICVAVGGGQGASGGGNGGVGHPVDVPRKRSRRRRGQRFVSEFRCDDGTGGPGIAFCLDNRRRRSDSFVDTSTLGTRVFTVKATSADGMATTAISRYTVVPRATLTKLRIRHGIITFTVRLPAGGAVAALATTSFKRSPLYGAHGCSRCAPGRCQ